MTNDTGRRVGPWQLGLLYLLVCLIWGTTWYGMKMSVETLPPITAAGLRFLVAFPFLLAVCLAAPGVSLLPPPGRRWVVPFIAVVYIAVPYALINYGEQHISSGLAALIFSSVVVFLLLFSVLISRISVSWMQWAGVVIGLGCLVGIVQLTAGISARGILAPAAVLLAAVMHALTYAVMARYGGTVHVLTQETLPIGLGALGLVILGVTVERPDLGAISGRSLTGVLYLGLVGSVIGFAAYFYLLQHVDAVLVSYVFVLFPVVALFGSAVLENSALPALAVVLAVVMLAAFGLTKKASGGRSAPAPAVPDAGSPLDGATLDAIYEHARIAYPGEACGFVHASGRVHEARNMADEMHRQDPVRFPRDAATGYVLPPADLIYLEDHLDGDDPVVVLYHSHPNGRAYFSDEDRRNALIDGVPLYPTLEQLVVGIDDTGVREARLFRCVDGEYTELRFLPGPDRRAAEVG
ncbi:Permease of the drug/metabolite transporter (DMT) superfamily [Micromonospora matsumotoense]|uniref:Permease of the drug/metabolite transporter (DMT) superfamily n=1 Tax=Micromonospora matsumotoense TaxID=121616 RepID=A0A1C4ZKR5_9ACTN|nr:EamA family transporter [Micromonospora matsumotoense]SCF33489.1 Permease of the drug/metabolite transporter (DMT) superfamily [Micromonospora matsumotoense]